MIENKSCQEFLVKGLSQEGTLRGVCGDKAKMGILLFLFFFATVGSILTLPKSASQSQWSWQPPQILPKVSPTRNQL